MEGSKMAKEVGQELGFESTELRLGQPGDINTTTNGIIMVKNEKKRVFSGSADDDDEQSKKQVVGWPPVCSYRRKNSFNDKEYSKMYVKVSMDGAPFLRKIDLSGHKGYNELTLAFENLFGCYGIGPNSDYIIIYEDKDGDWMLVGDVPWGIFVESCKRLRIMKKSDARGFGLHLKIFIKAALDDQ